MFENRWQQNYASSRVVIAWWAWIKGVPRGIVPFGKQRVYCPFQDGFLHIIQSLAALKIRQVPHHPAYGCQLAILHLCQKLVFA